jgi:hypothetical protein
MSNEVVYVSKVRIERVKGSLRRAYLPVEEQPEGINVIGSYFINSAVRFLSYEKAIRMHCIGG